MFTVYPIYSSRLLQLLGLPACVGVEGEPVAAWETVQVQIETERVRDMERRMTPRKAGVRRIRPESYSFR